MQVMTCSAAKTRALAGSKCRLQCLHLRRQLPLPSLLREADSRCVCGGGGGGGQAAMRRKASAQPAAVTGAVGCCMPHRGLHPPACMDACACARTPERRGCCMHACGGYCGSGGTRTPAPLDLVAGWRAGVLEGWLLEGEPAELPPGLRPYFFIMSLGSSDPAAALQHSLLDRPPWRWVASSGPDTGRTRNEQRVKGCRGARWRCMDIDLASMQRAMGPDESN